MGTELRATARMSPVLSLELTRYYLPPDTMDAPNLNRSQASWYSIYLPQMDRRL